MHISRIFVHFMNWLQPKRIPDLACRRALVAVASAHLSFATSEACFTLELSYCDCCAHPEHISPLSSRVVTAVPVFSCAHFVVIPLVLRRTSSMPCMSGRSAITPASTCLVIPQITSKNLLSSAVSFFIPSILVAALAGKAVSLGKL